MTHGIERDREINGPNIKNDFNVNGKLFWGVEKLYVKYGKFMFFLNQSYIRDMNITIQHSYNVIGIFVQLRLPNVSKPT